MKKFAKTFWLCIVMFIIGGALLVLAEMLVMLDQCNDLVINIGAMAVSVSVIIPAIYAVLAARELFKLYD